MGTIDILGSCVTRDAFKYDEENIFKINQYYARSSLISIYSKPVNVTLNDINLESNFQKRMVYNDLTSAFRKYIKNKTGDYLLIDFIDERMSVLKSGDSYVTRSREFINSKSNLKGTLLTGSEKLNKWKQSALVFSEEISKCFNVDKIILHKALWKEQYITKDGDIKTFEDKTIAEHNELLMQYYSFIEENLKGIKTIQLDDFHASEAHIWSLAPYHYQDEYYIEFMKQLKSLTKNN
ncbi:DUF6270 domain-containing protein [Bacillus cereus]|uniref:Uncharacterized protein n=1 Tax=Bacillus cereus TaxID=1396 RepID=A0AA44QBZ9_BACCE|nr:DUF6270 domain-containing protein [Bacillus cereus]PFN04201.1 hypothetical protein COJ55_22595 [Bacillus cereus]PFS02557.1 hypothetical protein COK38_09215 [Bacillus cereus]